MPLYKITFKDNSTFFGGDTVVDSKWKEIPDKAILCLEYFLSDESSLVLHNFEAYAAFTEAAENPLGNLDSKCPKCNKKVKLAKAVFTKDNKPIAKIVGRCINVKCNWVGTIDKLKNNKKSRLKYKYIMGLKNGIVTSYRIALEGTKGTDKYEKGDVTKRNYSKGKEYKGKPVADWVWKKGSK